MKKKIPSDPMIAVSFINTQLRDYYASLDEFCEEFETERAALELRMEEIGYTYNKEQNQFR